jgi:UDP-2,3-diacylglucosamine hydrolase
MRRLFISDVHLSSRCPERTEAFVRFLRREAPRTQELYILGDLFDYWFGPKHLTVPDYREALDALREVVGGGLRVVFIKGNRDFFLRGFAEATGIEVAAAGVEHRLTIAGRQVTLCHGDYLEGRSGPGFRFQEFIRSRFWEWIWTRLPVAVADGGARIYRWISGRRTRRPRPVRAAHLGPHGLCDETLLAEFRRGTDILVCGHVHVPQQVVCRPDGRETILFILGDWSDGECYLEEQDGQWRLIVPAKPAP